MAVGLTRTEQYALVGVVGLILAGLAIHGWRQRGGEDVVLVPGQGRWQKLAELEAGEQARLDMAAIEEALEPIGTVDLNSATPAELVRLPGIGPVRGRAILELRRRKGGFSSIDELLEVHGIGPATLERLRPYILIAPTSRTQANHAELSPAATPQSMAVEPAATPAGTLPATNAAPVNVNTADERELQKIKGIGPVLARRIVEHRRRYGPFRRVEDLEQVRGIGPASLEKMRPQIRIE
jgi:competence protein ComEA